MADSYYDNGTTGDCIMIENSDYASGDIVLQHKVPQAEYMYGCTATVVGMILGYYDLYGYNGRKYSNLIPGTVDVNSRGTDGNAYDMDAFDTVLGNFIASEEYVERFFEQTAAKELPYTFVNGDPAKGLNTKAWNCLADYLGTGQYYRGNVDYSTAYYYTGYEWLETTGQTFSVGSMEIPAKYHDFRYGLQLYLNSVGYSLDKELTKTYRTDNNDGTFTFEDYVAEIDAGRPVVISITAHSMLGYGYNLATKEILFDDTYKDGRMKWGGTYEYAGADRELEGITVIALSAENYTPEKLDAAVITASTTEPTNQSVTLTATFDPVAVKKEYKLGSDGEWTAYTGKITISKNMTVYFRATDINGDTVVSNYQVSNIDKTPPDMPTVSADITTQTSGPVCVTAGFGTDVVTKQYSLDGTNWLTYTKSLTFTKNGMVQFRGLDAAGNVSDIATYNVTNILNSAPGNLSPATITPSTTELTNKSITLTAVFDPVAVKKEYRLGNNGEWTTYTGKLTISSNMIVYFRGIDANGNTALSSYNVTNIDRTPPNKPTVSASITDKTTETVYVSAIFCADSVIKQYSLDGTTWSTYTGSIPFSENGTIQFRAIDAVGNVSAIASYSVTNIQSAAPGQPTASADTTLPTSGKVTVTAVFSEDTVTKQYSLDGTNWYTYTKEIVVSANCTIRFRGLNEAGTPSVITTYHVNNIVSSVPGDPVASADITTLTDGNVTVSAVFGNNTAIKQYSLDGEKWLLYTKAIVFETNGTVFFRGVNVAEETSSIISYTVNNIVTAPDAPEVSADITAVTNGSVTVYAVFSRNSVTKQYSIDGTNWFAYTDGVVLHANGTVYFRSLNGVGTSSEIVSYNVENIDKTPPESPKASANTVKPVYGPVTVSATFSNDTVVKEYSLDGENWLDYTRGITLSANGMVYFRGTDEAGNISQVTQYLVDNILAQPAAPENIDSTVKKYKVTCNWDKPDLAKGQKATYEILMDGKTYTAKSNKYSFKADPGTYEYQVRSIITQKGAANIVSAWSDMLNVTVADITPPKAGKITATQVEGEQDQVRIDISNSSDNVGIVRYEVRVNGVTVEDNLQTTSYIYNGNDLAGEKLKIEVYACDTKLQSKAAKKNIKVKDITPPDQVTGITVSPAEKQNQVTLSWDPGSDNVAVTQYIIMVDGKTYKSKKCTLTVKKLAAGDHTVTVYALDKAKEQSVASDEFRFTIGTDGNLPDSADLLPALNDGIPDLTLADSGSDAAPLSSGEFRSGLLAENTMDALLDSPVSAYSDPALSFQLNNEGTTGQLTVPGTSF